MIHSIICQSTSSDGHRHVRVYVSRQFSLFKLKKKIASHFYKSMCLVYTSFTVSLFLYVQKYQFLCQKTNIGSEEKDKLCISRWNDLKAEI